MITFDCAKMPLSLEQSALYVKISTSKEFTILRKKVKESTQLELRFNFLGVFFAIFGPFFAPLGED